MLLGCGESPNICSLITCMDSPGLTRFPRVAKSWDVAEECFPHWKGDEVSICPASLPAGSTSVTLALQGKSDAHGTAAFRLRDLLPEPAEPVAFSTCQRTLPRSRPRAGKEVEGQSQHEWSTISPICGQFQN